MATVMQESVTAKQKRLSETTAAIKANDLEMATLRDRIAVDTLALARERAISMRLALAKEELEEAIHQSGINEIKRALAPTASRRA